MPLKIEDIERAALTLPEAQRALLARHLLESLDAGQWDKDVEDAWVAEPVSRYDAYKRGEVVSELATNVFSDIRNTLKNNAN